MADQERDQSSGRQKLAYLLDPGIKTCSNSLTETIVGVSVKEEEMRQDVEVLLRTRVAELEEDLEEAKASVKALEDYSCTLRHHLLKYTEDVPFPPKQNGVWLAPKTDVVPLAVLGIRKAACSSCGSANVCLDRVFTELGELYCWNCWDMWLKCGWWKPSIRISTAPLQQYGPEDAFFLPEILSGHDDMTLFNALKDGLPEGKEFAEWHGGRHLGCQFEADCARHTTEAAPPVLKATVARMEKLLGITTLASRINLYRSNKDYKPLHFDRGQDANGTPQVTVGASFGATRELTLMHVSSGITATFPQRNGDIFAFTPELNKVFMHGVPKIGYGSPCERAEGEGERISLILWGSRVISS